MSMCAKSPETTHVSACRTVTDTAQRTTRSRRHTASPSSSSPSFPDRIAERALIESTAREQASVVRHPKTRRRTVKKILVGVDGSESSARAARFAANIARMTQADIELVYVYDAPAALQLGLHHLGE